ncbi:hypothetical protein RQP46_006697 [Phenoliferia psychrophenolica]
MTLLRLRLGPSAILALALFCVANAQAPTTATLQFGLPANGLRKLSISVGVLPDWTHEGPIAVNRAFGGATSIVGDYINVSPRQSSDAWFSQMEYHLPEILQVASGAVRPVYAPAIIYSDHLDTWTPAMTSGLAKAVAQVNKQGITVWLRLLFEMNGSWMPYGLQPDLLIQIWKDVTIAVRAETNQTFMLWSPNIWSGAVDDSKQGYTTFFPGEAYVDIAGLSYYSSGFNKSVNQPPSNNIFKTLFTPFYNLLNPTNLNSSSSNLLKLTAPIPIVISETSAPYYYELPSSSPYYNQAGDTGFSGALPNTSDYTPSLASPPYAHSDDELYIKASWFVQMTSNVTGAAFPNLIAVSLFNYFKRGGDEATPVLADFRVVGGNQTVEAWFRNDIGNQTAYDLGYTGGGGTMRVNGFVGAVAALVVAVALLLP